ncbi:MAG: hypothetical protein H6720_01605 [Sandaracinus sp.]|nr:hypothetical protein [Sandaracinus sp.]
MRKLRIAALALVALLGCAPTETGNPSASVDVIPQTDDVRGFAPRVGVEQFILGGVRIDFLRGEPCDLPEPLVDVESYEALTKRGERIELATTLPVDTYCGVEGEVYPSARIDGLVLAIDGTRLEDNAPVRIRAHGDALPLAMSLRTPFVVPEEGVAVHFLVDVDVVISTVPELATLRANPDGVVEVDETHSPEVLAQVLARLPNAVMVLEDTNRNGVVDGQERELPIAFGPDTVGGP